MNSTLQRYYVRLACGTEFDLAYSDLLPPLTPQELETLREDIGNRGILVPILIDESRRVIDGQHRLKAAQELGWPADRVPQQLFLAEAGVPIEDQHRSAALGLNLHRRHLDRQSRARVVAQLKASGLSNRAIAAQIGVGETTVRRELECSVAPNGAVEHRTEDPPEQIEERRSKVQQLRSAGKSIREIAEEAGVSVGTVHADLKQEPPERTPEDEVTVRRDLECSGAAFAAPNTPERGAGQEVLDRPLRIQKAREAGRTVGEIARREGIARSTVRAYLEAKPEDDQPPPAKPPKPKVPPISNKSQKPQPASGPRPNPSKAVNPNPRPAASEPPKAVKRKRAAAKVTDLPPLARTSKAKAEVNSKQPAKKTKCKPKCKSPAPRQASSAPKVCIEGSLAEHNLSAAIFMIEAAQIKLQKGNYPRLVAELKALPLKEILASLEPERAAREGRQRETI